MSYLNSVMIVGFFGADPEQRQARNSGSKFTVLSVATQRSWKNVEDEWVSKVEWHRVAIFRPRLAEAVLTNIKKGSCPRRRQPRQLLRSFRRHSVLAFRLLKPSGDAGGLFGGGWPQLWPEKEKLPVPGCLPVYGQRGSPLPCFREARTPQGLPASSPPPVAQLATREF
jgi:hypothetical protein